MNILRDQILKTEIRKGFRFDSNSDERERRESRQLLVTAVGSRPKTACAVICRLRRVAAGPLRLALPDPSIDRRSSCSRTSGWKAVFRTLNKVSS